jgi:hypothetical protein
LRLTTEPLVEGAIDFPHPARTDWRQDGIGSKPLADEHPLSGEVTGHIRSRERRRFQKPTRRVLVFQQRLDLMPQRVIAGAQLGQHGRPLGLRPRHDGAVDTLDLRPAFRHALLGTARLS